MRFPQLKALRESRKFALAGGLVGAAHLGGVALKFSKAPHGMTDGVPLRPCVAARFSRSVVTSVWFSCCC
jgi:hypothetical protein